MGVFSDHVKLVIAILDVPVLVTILGDETYPVLSR